MTTVLHWYHIRRFLSTLSLRRATSSKIIMLVFGLDFYPRSPCGERLQKHSRYWRGQIISIHALLAESDGFDGQPGCDSTNFYPRSPCGERPQISARALRSWAYFYPRSPCGERLCKVAGNAFGRGFLSTLSLRRATAEKLNNSLTIKLFLSTLSLRRATNHGKRGTAKS